MDDLTRIEKDLEKKHAAEALQHAEILESFQEQARASVANLSALAARLQSFDKSVSRRVPIHISKPTDGHAFIVSISTNFPWFRRPDYKFKIVAGPTATSFQISLEDSDAFFNEHNRTEEEVVADLSKFVGQVIENPKPYRRPQWLTATYYVIAAIIGVIAFFGTWIAIGISGGIFGVLLGWIPALLVAYLAGYLWPIGAILLIGAMLRG